MNWPLVLILRLAICLAVTFAALYFFGKSRKAKIACCVLGVLLALMVPEKWVYKDGGTTQYWSPLYTVIKWKRLDGTKTGTDIYIFPFNFADLDYYYDH